uniref:Uncharacterized protein n=1 Tax=Parascaris univalens TaxID=6257 RepID=A0A915A7Y6_PARUN
MAGNISERSPVFPTQPLIPLSLPCHTVQEDYLTSRVVDECRKYWQVSNVRYSSLLLLSYSNLTDVLGQNS